MANAPDGESVHDPGDESAPVQSTHDHPDRTAPGGHGRAAQRPLVATGSSRPGQPGYDGQVTIGDEGGSATPESYREPFDREDSDALDPASVPEHTKEMWRLAEEQDRQP